MNLMILDPTNEAVPVERHISERPKTLTGKVAVSYTHLTLPTIYSV